MTASFAQLERRIAEEQQTLARPLRSLLGRAPVVCTPELPAMQAAALMRAERVGSLVVVDAAARPIGIVTSRDLLDALAADGGARPIGKGMTPSPFSLPPHALAYEAALAMSTRRIRHVLVIEAGRLLGVVSERDLFGLQRLALGELTMEIRLAEEIESVAGLAAEVRQLTARLVSQGVAAEQLMSLVSVLNDRLSQRVIEIVRKRHDLERISWCWLAFGSEGRLEQTFSSDQDNGLLFEAHEAADPVSVRARLLPFAREVNEALDACGFALCKGNVMASNPQLCLSAAEWRGKMGSWIESSSPKALLGAVICFDLRPLFGDASLADDLRAWVHERTSRFPVFLRHMAENALRAQPAIGRLGAFVTEAVPGAEGTLDLKASGARIFVDAARIFALGHAAPQTNTAERLRAVHDAIGMSEAETAAAVDAFHALQALRLRLQAQAQAAGVPGHNRVDPAKLGRIESAVLKESLRVAHDLQGRLALHYQL